MKLVYLGPFIQISKDVVVSMNDALKDHQGSIVDQSKSDPVVYLHGGQSIILGLEREFEGKQAGDKLDVTVAPEKGYGVVDQEAKQVVPRDMFPEDTAIEVGMQFHGAYPAGNPIVVTVETVDGDEIVIDGNHELAGKTLHFSVEITEVRGATQDELAHGHMHGLSCNH